MTLTTSDPLALDMKVAALEHRVEVLETRAFGEPQPEPVELTLRALYVKALMGRVDRTSTSAELWNHVVLCLNEEILLGLGRYAQDPLPWKPLLLVLDHLDSWGFDTAMATDHLIRVARNMMDLQGLERLYMGDVVGGVIDVRSAYQLGERRTRSDGQKEEGRQA